MKGKKEVPVSVCVLIINVLWSRPSAVYLLNIIFNALLFVLKGSRPGIRSHPRTAARSLVWLMADDTFLFRVFLLSWSV